MFILTWLTPHSYFNLNKNAKLNKSKYADKFMMIVRRVRVSPSEKELIVSKLKS